jgi:hypothetical protein
MERLTGRDAYGDIVANEEMQIIASRGTTYDDLHNIINHLAEKLCEYEDLEEKGRLTKLPCKVGDTVYGISMGKIINLTVNEISIFYMKGEKIINVKCQSNDEFRNYVEREFGKTVFLSKEEAEAVINKLKGKDNKDIERD